jgi:hypothetical protein
MHRFIQDAFEEIKHARWLTRPRLICWGGGFALLSLLLLARDTLTSPPGITEGGDFPIFWSGAVLAAAGRPEAAYAIGPDHTFEQALPYPPIMILLCRPLAGLSQTEALLLWFLLGAALYAFSLSRFVGWRIAGLAIFGTPAALCNIICGQNGYFTAALLGWGLALVDRRPVTAGILLGMLGYKPQFGILVPVALVAGRYWKTAAAAAACVGLLAATSMMLLGMDAWISFFHRLMLQRQLTELGTLLWTRMPTVFIMIRLLGISSPAAYALQGLSTICAAVAIAGLWHARCPLAVKSAGLVIAAFLATPYAWDYDAVVLTFAAAWLANEGARTGFRPWEKITVLVLLTMPLLSFTAARLLHLPIAPILFWLSLAVVVRRGLGLGFSSAMKPVRTGASQSAV